MLGSSDKDQGDALARYLASGPGRTDAEELVAMAVKELAPPVSFEATCIDHARKVVVALLDNAYRHVCGLDLARTGAGQPFPHDVRLDVRVTLRGEVRCLQIEVQDPGSHLALDWAGGGTGFWTVRLFADEYGVRPMERGKAVWAVLRLDGRSLRRGPGELPE